MMISNLALDGMIFTIGSSQPNVEAIAAKEDRIVKVGTNEEASLLIEKIKGDSSIGKKGCFRLSRHPWMFCNLEGS
jgi:predicted amidohydrolase YtcJ